MPPTEAGAARPSHVIAKIVGSSPRRAALRRRRSLGVAPRRRQSGALRTCTENVPPCVALGGRPLGGNCGTAIRPSPRTTAGRTSAGPAVQRRFALGLIRQIRVIRGQEGFVPGFGCHDGPKVELRSLPSRLRSAAALRRAQSPSVLRPLAASSGSRGLSCWGIS